MLCEKHTDIKELKEQGLAFVEMIKNLLQRLMEYRHIIYDENKEHRMSCIVNLLVSGRIVDGQSGIIVDGQSGWLRQSGFMNSSETYKASYHLKQRGPSYEQLALYACLENTHVHPFRKHCNITDVSCLDPFVWFALESPTEKLLNKFIQYGTCFKFSI